MDVLRSGDPQGNRMALRLTTLGGTVIHAIGVPQDWPSRTGPTWCYVLENEGTTLIDPGAQGSFAELKDGLAAIGYGVRDIDRVIVTHGHADHDGSAAELMDSASDAHLWAHRMYAALIGYNPWEVQDRASSPIHAEMRRVAESGGAADRQSRSYAARNQRYIDARKGLTVHAEVVDGDRVGELSFIYAPGHSPDELCLTLDGVVFSGDHVLPEITPHPTTKAGYADHVARDIPAEFSDPAASYGLEAYMRSLKTVLDLGEDRALLPAHRLYNRGKFNFASAARRAGEVINHHGRRMEQILRRIDDRPTGLEEVTRGVFERRKLIGGNLFMALSEIVAHIEVLQDLGDVEFADSKLRRTGGREFRQFVRELVN